MPINSLDHLMRKTTDGSLFSADWMLTTNIAFAAGRWQDMSRNGIYPSPNLYPGTSLTWVDCNSSTAFAIPAGPDTVAGSGMTKHCIFGSAATAVTTGVPGMFVLVDLQGYWPGISTNTTSPQSLSGTPSLRYTNGEGLKLYPVVTTTTSTGTPNISISYTNQAGTSGRALGQTVTSVASSPIGSLYANLWAPFLPLAGGDTGVQNVASVTMSAATTGAIALCLAKPILTVPVATVSNMVERDFVNQFTSLPRIMNNACLTWLFYPGAATVINSNFYGSLEFVWG
jgi:hypothetical protein